jgi:hypothetical protein
MLDKLLNNLGLNDTQTKVFLSLYEIGRATPLLISKRTGIKRTTVYSALEELKREGLVKEDKGQKVKHYLIPSAEILLDYLEAKERKMIQTKSTILSLRDELKKIPKSSHFSLPRVQYAGGRETVDFLYRNTPDWIKSMEANNETTLWGFQDHTYLEDKDYLGFIDWYWGQFEDSTDLKLLTNKEQSEIDLQSNKQYPKRQIKYWADSDFTSSLWVAGDYVITVYTGEKPHYLIQINDRLMAHNLRNLFRCIWSLEI